jgi:hypothetical protein
MKYFSLIFLLLFISCAAKKTTKQTKEIVKNDTIIITKYHYIFKAVRDGFLIESPCDTLGILKPFKQRLVTAQGNITIEGKNNTITAEINLDSIVQSIEKKYKSTIVKSTEKEAIEIVRYKTPLWLIVTAAFSVLLNFVLIKK